MSKIKNLSVSLSDFKLKKYQKGGGKNNKNNKNSQKVKMYQKGGGKNKKIVKIII
jgi:hypothetical protein